MKGFKLILASDNKDLNPKAIRLSKKIKLPFVGQLADLKKSYKEREDIFNIVFGIIRFLHFCSNLCQIESAALVEIC